MSCDPTRELGFRSAPAARPPGRQNEWGNIRNEAGKSRRVNGFGSRQQRDLGYSQT
jgi:hypothetical protein